VDFQYLLREDKMFVRCPAVESYHLFYPVMVKRTEEERDVYIVIIYLNIRQLYYIVERQAMYTVQFRRRLPLLSSFFLFTIDIVYELPSNRVISSPFSHKTFFFTRLREGTPYFFMVVNSIKNWFRCWHSQFWPWLTYKPLFFIFP